MGSCLKLRGVGGALLEKETRKAMQCQEKLS